MKLAVWTGIIGTILAGILVLDQVWWDLVSPNLFVKLQITIGVVVGVVVLASLIRDGYSKEKKQKQDRLID